MRCQQKRTHNPPYTTHTTHTTPITFNRHNTHTTHTTHSTQHNTPSGGLTSDSSWLCRFFCTYPNADAGGLIFALSRFAFLRVGIVGLVVAQNVELLVERLVLHGQLGTVGGQAVTFSRLLSSMRKRHFSPQPLKTRDNQLLVSQKPPNVILQLNQLMAGNSCLAAESADKARLKPRIQKKRVVARYAVDKWLIAAYFSAHWGAGCRRDRTEQRR